MVGAARADDLTQAVFLLLWRHAGPADRDSSAARSLLRDRVDSSAPRLDSRTILGAVAVVAGSLLLVIILLLRDA